MKQTGVMCRPADWLSGCCACWLPAGGLCCFWRLRVKSSPKTIVRHVFRVQRDALFRSQMVHWLVQVLQECRWWNFCYEKCFIHMMMCTLKMSPFIMRSSPKWPLMLFFSCLGQKKITFSCFSNKTSLVLSSLNISLSGQTNSLETEPCV